MYGVFYIRSVSVGLDSQILYLFIYITGYLNVRKISETMDFRSFVGPLINVIVELILTLGFHKISTRYLGFSALQERKRDKTMLPAADVGHGMKRSFG